LIGLLPLGWDVLDQSGLDKKMSDMDGTSNKSEQALSWLVRPGEGMISHRSGETVDSFIPDFTVAMVTRHLKIGASCRRERVEKYNQHLRIE